jgi:ATP-dependent Lhr-like helicase
MIMMNDLSHRLALKDRLPRTWLPFFERHGNFTAAQLAAIPHVLDGHNVMLCAATASGKTEAALAPLIERHCPPLRSRSLRILYLTPTRALVSDLAARLASPLEALDISLGVKTSDLNTFRPRHPPDVLLTTPESADSLLATHARLLASLRAVIIDELHLFDGTPRGDQMRILLQRIRRIREHAAARGDAEDAIIQYVALSASLGAPAAVAARYFGDAHVVQAPGSRSLAAELLPLSPVVSDELLAYLQTFRQRGWRKALVFCNSRAEIEAYATAIRGRPPFGEAVYVHYSNLDPRHRREIEQRFAAAPAAICLASSTLELGIDVGDIDVIILIGPPGNVASFTQRIGRGNRRSGVMRLAGFYRTTLEQLLFEALVDTDTATDTRIKVAAMDTASETADDNTSSQSVQTVQNPCALFRPAVAVQQIFSLIKQSPTAAVRLAELARLFDGLLSRDDLAAIIGELTQRGYLKEGRPGEWRAGERLNDLVDQQASSRPGPSIHSNIAGSNAPAVVIRDQHTQEVVARVDPLWLGREMLTLEGRPINVEWSDGEVMLVSSARRLDAAEPLFYRSERQLLSYELAQLLQGRLGLAPGMAPFVAVPDGWLWFHFLGDLYGRAALDLLRYKIPAGETTNVGLCIRLPDEPRALPEWPAAQVTRYLQDNYRSYEPLLALGPFQHLLPLKLRRRAVVEQFDQPRFLAALAALHPVVAPEELGEELAELIEDD